MHKHMRLLIFMAIVLLAIAFPGAALAQGDKELLELAKEYFEPLPSKPEFKKDNPGSAAKIELGKMLYFDKRLSSSNVFSCNSCHDLALGGTDNSSFSIGHKWKKGGRNAPTVFNAALHLAQFWDGRAEDVEQQAGMPVLNPVEMNASEGRVIERLGSIPEYAKMFADAFPGEKSPLTYKNVAKAIGAFERTLLTPSRFDQFLAGKLDAITKAEKEGLKLFIDTDCVICHNGVTVGGQAYQKFGVFKKPDFLTDNGRFDVTRNKDDMYVFKVPSLRNIELTYPYFNNGAVWDLKEAVKIMAEVQLGNNLSDQDAAKIVVFLKSLTGDKPKIELPLLPPATVSTSRPDTD
ncbi:MAG: cytochrome-c peroxidase [Nitrospinota bacterium]|nr:cytochrome-c peroxidase [Nitrospinota bacterium]